MSKQLNTLTTSENGNIKGIIATRSLRADVVLLPLKERRGKDSPHFEVCEVVHGGELLKLGAAWEKVPNSGDASPFLSLTIDDPEFAAPLNFSAFPRGNGNAGVYDVKWSRPRRKEEEKK